MKKVFYLAAVAVALTSCQKQAKIGFVDNGVVINDYQEKKDVETKYEEKEAAFRKKADSIGQAFQMEVQSKQAEAQKSSQAKAQELMAGLQQKQQQLQQQMQVEQQMMQQAFQADIDSVINHVKAFVKDYGKDNGYTYILGTSEAAATVMYGVEEDDLTKTITDALNEAYKK
ncbi:OmpH family outer membrane protein [Aestuariibaculum lutulentum]|uniref:OmpH family outer membrane protein n=1 Tax=Aestuariibaculum lutulentum TaxID=2920935 RepID=A0ABS9RGR3_9FLAO|nr:OmpH family outer membrane protein [Aestuariibaculum lutulentum]MCH4552138.1 OmpH family outer membrane protein [Aestuariibaculum lutulentum]